jgi:hypothetical protein
MKRIVDRGKGNSDLGAARLFVQHFRGEVTVALREQKPAKRYALTRWAQADLAQKRLDIMPRAAVAAVR